MWKRKESWNQMNCHHKIGQSLKNYFVVEDTRNKIIMNMQEHNHLHWFFKLNLTPKSQFNKLKELNQSVMSDLAIALLTELVNLSDKDFYSPWLVINGKQRNFE